MTRGAYRLFKGMKENWIWIKTEYKRAAFKLPAALGRAVILLVVVGMIAFCAQKLWSVSANKEPVQIGYASEENALIRLAVSYVENMEAVKGLCRFVPVEEEAGKALLKEGELAALLVLPENMIEGILSGSNEPASLYLTENPSPEGLIFEELAGAATGLLQTAQAEIYAMHALTEYFQAEGGGLAQAYQEIDAFNLGIVMEREQYFKFRRLSETGNTGFAVYYASAFFTLYLFVSGMFLGGFLKRSREEMLLLKKRRGITYGTQLLGRMFIVAGCMLLLLFVTGLLWLSGSVRDALQVSFSVYGIFLAVLAACCAAAGLLFVYLPPESERSAVLPAGLLVVFMCYASGCFVPSAILPEVVNRLAAVLPTTYVKKAFTVLFSGEKEEVLKTAAFLCGFCVLFLLGALSFVYGGERRRREKEQKAPVRMGETSVRADCRHLWEGEEATAQSKQTKKNGLLFWILGKRLLYKKTIWLCLLCMVLLSALQYHLEKQSDAVITAAVYTPDTELRVLISEYEGLVHFLVCEDSEEVKRNVVRGNAECGYVLQEDLQEQIMAGNGTWSIEVYEKADSTMTRVVNEVLFERIFYAISAEWFEGYIAGNEMFADVREEAGEDALREEAGRQLANRLSDDSTFRFEHVTVLDAASLADGASTEGGQREPAGSSVEGGQREPAGGSMESGQREPAGGSMEDGQREPAGSSVEGGQREPAGSSTEGGQREPAGSSVEGGQRELAGSSTEAGQKARTAYPAEAAAGAGIVLCGIAGVLEALQDIKKKRFRGRTALMAGVFTVLQPVLCGILAAFGILCATRGGAALGRQTAVLLLLAAAVALVGIGTVLLRRIAERS